MNPLSLKTKLNENNKNEVEKIKEKINLIGNSAIDINFKILIHKDKQASRTLENLLYQLTT